MNERAREGSKHFLIFFAVAVAVLVVVAAVVGSSLAPTDRLRATVIPTDVISLTNHDRIAAGLAPLTRNPLLDNAAQKKADDMAARSYFAHIDDQGRSPLFWLQQVGYQYQNVGENLGLNYASADALETGWMNSSEHRANIMRSAFTEVGIGVSEGVYQGFPATFAVELFATPLPGAGARIVPVSKVMPVTQSTLSQEASTTTEQEAYADSLRALILELQKQIQQLTAQLH